MAQSRIRFGNSEADYAVSTLTHYRIYQEDGPDGIEWWLDAIDDNGNYSEALWTFDAFDKAVAALPEFASRYPLGKD